MADEQNTGSNILSYIGEDELKHFLDWMVRLCSKKYMPINGAPGRAQSAATADKLTNPVSINGQVFDGTQDITFDEYARKEDVIRKTDYAKVGAEDNSNKIVTLNLDGKIDDEFLGTGNAQEIVDLAISKVDDRIDVLESNYEVSFGDVRTTEKNDIDNVNDAISKLHYVRANVTVDEKDLPACISLEGEYENFYVPPIEVLKQTKEEQKTDTLDYKALGYESNYLSSVESHRITFKPLEIPLAVNLDYEYLNDITSENYEEHKNGWIKASWVRDDANNKIYFWNIVFASDFFENISSLKTFSPKSNFYYGVVTSEGRTYRISSNKLTYAGSSDDPKTIVSYIKGGSLNVALTKDMLKDASFPKNGDVTIILVAEEEEVIKPFDISVCVVATNGYIVETKKFLTYFNVSSIEKFTAQYKADEDCEIKFAIKMFNEAKQQSEVKVFEDGEWVTIPTEDIEVKAHDISELPGFSSDAWNKAGSFSFLFFFKPKTYNSSCELDNLQVSYTRGTLLTKALYGTDYTYSYINKNIIMFFYTDGEYLINYLPVDYPPHVQDGDNTAVSGKAYSVKSIYSF